MLRIIGAVFLIIAFLAALLGYVAPFWTTRLSNETSLMGAAQNLMDGQGPTPAPITTTMRGFNMPNIPVGLGQTTPAKKLVTEGPDSDGYFWEGLMAKCYANLTCKCIFEDDFKMEIDFPGNFVTYFSGLKAYIFGLCSCNLAHC